MKNKKVTVNIISILIILILLLVLSYAFFKTQLSGTEGIVKVGELELVLNETSEGIKLDNAIGLSDSEGLSLDSSTFKLINNGSKAVDYIIYLDDNTIGDTDTRIDDKYLKYNLNKNGINSGASMLTSIGKSPKRILDSGTIEGKGTNGYSLNLWITSDVDGNYSGQVFSGKLRVEVSQKSPTVSEILLANISKDNLYDDGVDTFITGKEPNNYIWYSGKLWRAVSINNEEKTVKLVTQWNISAISYNVVGNTAFSGSHMEQWLNDTSVDGFLSNLRDYENFIVTDAKWDATMDDTTLGNITRPNGETTVIDAVGLLNMYEYQSSSGVNNLSYTDGYLNNGLQWITLTPSDPSFERYVSAGGNVYNVISSHATGVRPSINLKSNVKVVNGNGTKGNPYRLKGDNDTNLQGARLSSRYSGEYVLFGNDENNLYRIVSHENGTGTKIVSAKPLKSSGTFITSVFGDNVTFSSSNNVGSFLNGDYLTNYVDSRYSNMIEDSTTWYLGTVGIGVLYKLAKYTDAGMSGYAISTDAKVGLLRIGELMSGQFESYGNSTIYWLLTAYSASHMYYVSYEGYANFNSPSATSGVRPAVNLKSNVIITEGDGTIKKPFKIKLR